MTLAEKYNEAMNKIELSAEARARILGNIQKMDLDAPRHGKVIQFPQWKRWAAMAACAAVVLLAAVALNPRGNTDPNEQQGGVAIANGIVEYASVRELSESLGFTMPELTDLPFSVAETVYANYWGDMGQISYADAEQRITLRMQPGNEDISGDFNNYTEIKSVTINGCEVTLKGNGGTVNTAIWTRDGYSYAVSADVPLSAEAMSALIAHVA